MEQRGIPGRQYRANIFEFEPSQSLAQIKIFIPSRARAQLRFWTSSRAEPKTSLNLKKFLSPAKPLRLDTKKLSIKHELELFKEKHEKVLLTGDKESLGVCG